MIADNVDSVLAQIRRAEESAGRPAGSVRLLAVSKFHPAEAVLEAVRAGLSEFGENRVQEAAEKFNCVRLHAPQARLHIIGRLQRNKVKKAVEIASCIESVDRLELLQEINRHCERVGKSVEILLEFHTGEESKGGFPDYSSLENALAYCADGLAPYVVPVGVMTMAPLTQEEAPIRASFRKAREALAALRRDFPHFSLETLSMGMSGDFRIAIEEGSTEVRIGSAIFGPRTHSV